MKRRSSGILLHPACLSGRYGIGDLGPGAFRFVDFLKAAGQSCWQMLPVNPSTSGAVFSPYDCASAFAGNPLLISPDALHAEGYVTIAQCQAAELPNTERISYTEAARRKQVLLLQAFKTFRAQENMVSLHDFALHNHDWIDDYALFHALKQKFRQAPWWRWPMPLRRRERQALVDARQQLENAIQLEIFIQFIFDRQWQALGEYCRKQNILRFGDMPIYVSRDSADVWAHSECFKLSEHREPLFVSGVPPDRFSRTGQLWGNPVFDWKTLERQGYGWWLSRLGRNFDMFDLLRIDHFRGLIAYWEVPFTHKTARNGKWVKVPTASFFDAVFRRYPFAPLIAEDLGTITPDVITCIQRYQLPGMRVLQFAFDSEPCDGLHYPHAYPRDCVAYTGTHDNNTARGWFEKEATQAEKNRLTAYAGRSVSSTTAAAHMMRLVMASPADLAVFPIQDGLGLGAGARMNRPGKSANNWRWRMKPNALSTGLQVRLKDLTETFGRL